MWCRAVIQGEWHSAAGNPTWEYEFDRAIPPRPHAVHSGDLPYVFGNLLKTGSQGGDFQERDILLSEQVQGYWTRFAATGNPNAPGSPTWPAHDGKSRSFLVFGAAGDVRVGADQRGPFCELFREALGPESR